MKLFLADSAYLSEEAREHLLECTCDGFIQLKGYRNHPLGEEEKQTKEPYSGKSGAGIWEDEPVCDGSITNDWEGVSASSHRVEQSGIQHGSVRVLDEEKLERETKQLSEMVDRRENEAQSDQMKADGRGVERTSGPFQKYLSKKKISVAIVQGFGFSTRPTEVDLE